MEVQSRARGSSPTARLLAVLLDQRALLGPRFTFISETFLSVSVCVWSVMSHSDFLGY